MRSHLLGLDVWFCVGYFIYFHTSCVRTAKALLRLRGFAGSPEPSLVTCVISTIISWAGSVCLLIIFTQHKFITQKMHTQMIRHMAKPAKWPECPAKTQISLGTRPVWLEALLSAWRNLRSLATQWAYSKNSDWVDAQAVLSLLRWMHRSLCCFCHVAAQI